jgi:hypothetical protein
LAYGCKSEQLAFCFAEVMGSCDDFLATVAASMRVSLQKGCYCGQEIIARSHHLGKAKRQLLTFTTICQLPSLQPGQTQYLCLPKFKDSPSRKITILFGATIQNTQYIQACGPILQTSDAITLSQKPEDFSATAISVTPV